MYKKQCRSTVYVFIFVGVNFRGHFVIHENNLFVNPRKFLLGESTKISVVQLQLFLRNDPFLLKRRLIASLLCDDSAIKIVLFLYLSSQKWQKGQRFSFFSP